MQKKFFRLFFLLLFFLIIPNFSKAALNVPLTIQETLPAGIVGLDRSNENFSSGIPLAEDSGITNVNQLGLTNSTAAQFRAIGWWPNGNIKWVLVDGQTSVAVGGSDTTKALTTGTGNFGGSDLATDNGSNISVNTGNAQFVIKKTNFNIFDSVIVDGQTLVTTGNVGRVSAVGLDGLEYASNNDLHTQVGIEENGPVRSVIKVMGALENSSNARLMDYTLRIHFYKNSSKVKSFVTLRNASKNFNSNIGFLSVRVIVPLSIGTVKNVIFSRKNDAVSGVLPAGKNAFMFQGENSSFNISDVTNCYPWSPPASGTCVNNVFTYDSNYQGLGIDMDNVQLNTLGNRSDWSRGWASFNDSSNKGVTVAMKFFSANWPNGFEFDDSGDASIELFSKHAGNNPLKLIFGSHEGRELIWDFHSALGNDDSSLYALQYPLFARATFDQYVSTRVMFGQDEFVNQSEEQTFFSQVGVRSAPSFSNPSFTQYFREWYWPTTGGGNQTDIALSQMSDYLRTGNAGFYVEAAQRSIFNSDVAVPHSDDFVTDNVVLGIDPLPSQKSLNGGFVDFEHANMNVIPFHYFLTGNEDLKESYLDYGEYLNRTQVSGYFAASPLSVYARAWYRRLRNMAMIYEFSKDVNAINSSLIVTVENAINGLLDSRDVPGQNNGSQGATIGRNLERGYIYLDKTICITPGLSGNNCSVANYGRALHSFFHGMIGFEGLWQIHRIFQDTNYNFIRMQDFEDVLTGFSQFFFKEYITPSSNTYAWEYDYPLDVPHSTFGLSPYPTSRAALWAYQNTGDIEMLNKGAAIVEGFGGSFSPSELQDQALIWSYLNKTLVPTWHLLSSSVIDNGGGSYTLNWTVPAGVQKIQIKYSSKPIVEWLGYDKTSGLYQYDPVSFTPFFAANNIVNNPIPAATGTVQNITLTGLPLNQNFSVKFLSTVQDVVAPNAPIGLSVL